jgi:hypothetical protein
MIALSITTVIDVMRPVSAGACGVFGDSLAVNTRKAEVSHIYYVWMMQTAGSSCLAPESFDELVVHHELRRDDFDCDGPAGAQVGREIDRAHPAFAELLLDAVFLVEHFTGELC